MLNGVIGVLLSLPVSFAAAAPGAAPAAAALLLENCTPLVPQVLALLLLLLSVASLLQGSFWLLLSVVS